MELSGLISIGSSLETIIVVDDEHTAMHVGSGSLRVLATPIMIALMESTSHRILAQHLPQGYSSVGVMVNVRHLAPTPMGCKVRVRSELVKLEGSKASFEVQAWDEHEFILKKLEALPQVFCHQDAFRRNLFARAGKTIAIDWSYLGIAPLGTELVALVAASLGFREIPAEKVLELDRQCFEGYLQGLREAGWQGDPKLVRKGYALGLMMRYPIGGQVGEMLPAFLEQARRARVASAFENTTADEIEKADPAILAYYEKVLPETLKMMGMVGMLRMVGRIGLHALILKIRRKK